MRGRLLLTIGGLALFGAVVILGLRPTTGVAPHPQIHIRDDRGGITNVDMQLDNSQLPLGTTLNDAGELVTSCASVWTLPRIPLLQHDGPPAYHTEFVDGSVLEGVTQSCTDAVHQRKVLMVVLAVLGLVLLGAALAARRSRSGDPAAA